MRILYTMPLCGDCQARKAELVAQGIVFEERPLLSLAGDIPAAALWRMGLATIYARRAIRGETMLVAPVEVERNEDSGEWKLIGEGGARG